VFRRVSSTNTVITIGVDVSEDIRISLSIRVAGKCIDITLLYAMRGKLTRPHVKFQHPDIG
jgi:hypothetical protein